MEETEKKRHQEFAGVSETPGFGFELHDHVNGHVGRLTAGVSPHVLTKNGDYSTSTHHAPLCYHRNPSGTRNAAPTLNKKPISETISKNSRPARLTMLFSAISLISATN